MAYRSENVILPELREWRSEIRALFSRMHEQFEGIAERLDRMESGQQAIRQMFAVDLMLSKRFSGDFEAALAAWFDKE